VLNVRSHWMIAIALIALVIAIVGSTNALHIMRSKDYLRV